MLAAAGLLAVVLRPLIASTLERPLGLLYGVAVRYVESLPQIYLWAGLLGAAALVGLRRLPLRDPEALPPQPPTRAQRGRLGNWVRLLAERERGTYFEWRLANRLAQLERWIGAPNRMDTELQSYLDLGRNQRTIQAEPRLSRLNFELERLVGYLEDALDRS